MSQVIGVVQGKGGTGRSTVSTNLAGGLSTHYPTALIDCDMPQGTSASWAALRHAEKRMGNLTIATAPTHRSLVDQAKRLGQTHRFLVVDAPPRIAEITRAILILSSLVVIPIGPSAAEVWATTDVLKTIEEARAHRPNLLARLLWTRIRRRTKVAQQIPGAVNEELHVQSLKSVLGQRVAYTEALACGRTVSEWGDPVARQELDALVTEVVRVVGR
ncbi:MAG: ParA family protein [Thermodesulfobacteriota bacterium]